MTRSDSGGIVTYSYDDNDRLLSETGGMGTTYVYDANGNTVGKTTGSLTTEYAYDYEDRLTGILTGSDPVSYQYDPAGNRVSKSVNGVTTRYLVDAYRAYSEVLAETDVAGNLLAEYVHGNDLISQTRAGVSHWYHYDGQYSVRQLTDVSGTIANTYKYDAFGRLRNQTGSAVNDHLYTGEQYDPHADAYYLRARYYNQTVGRFISADIFPGFNFDPASKNRYAYASNNPVNNYDFSGLMTASEQSNTVGINNILFKITIKGVRKAHDIAGDLGIYDHLLGEYAIIIDVIDAVGGDPGAIKKLASKVGKKAKNKLKKKVKKNADGLVDFSKSRTKWGKEHGTGNVKHNNAIEDELDWAHSQQASAIKKNKRQIDVYGNKVNAPDGKRIHPDASYTLEGKRYNTNYASNYQLDNLASSLFQVGSR